MVEFRLHPFLSAYKLSNVPQKSAQELKQLPIVQIMGAPTDLGTNVKLEGVSVFIDNHTPSWESQAAGGQITWRGAINNVKIPKIWRLLCCWFLSSDRSRNFIGFRMINKSTSDSPQIKLELWCSDQNWKPLRTAALKILSTVLPACDTQFRFVNHMAKIKHLKTSKSTTGQGTPL